MIEALKMELIQNISSGSSKGYKNRGASREVGNVLEAESLF
jgi:hypothetical protein